MINDRTYLYVYKSLDGQSPEKNKVFVVREEALGFSLPILIVNLALHWKDD